MRTIRRKWYVAAAAATITTMGLGSWNLSAQPALNPPAAPEMPVTVPVPNVESLTPGPILVPPLNPVVPTPTRPGEPAPKGNYPMLPDVPPLPSKRVELPEVPRIPNVEVTPAKRVSDLDLPIKPSLDLKGPDVPSLPSVPSVRNLDQLPAMPAIPSLPPQGDSVAPRRRVQPAAMPTFKGNDLELPPVPAPPAFNTNSSGIIPIPPSTPNKNPEAIPVRAPRLTADQLLDKREATSISATSTTIAPGTSKPNSLDLALPVTPTIPTAVPNVAPKLETSSTAEIKPIPQELNQPLSLKIPEVLSTAPPAPQPEPKAALPRAEPKPATGIAKMPDLKIPDPKIPDTAKAADISLPTSLPAATTVTTVDRNLDILSGRLSISTMNEAVHLKIFGALQAHAVFSTARTVIPGTPFFLSPDNGTGSGRVDFQAQSSSIGAVLSGPEVYGFQTGGFVLAYFYNQNVFDNRYGILPLLAWADIKNENWRFAAGLQSDVFNPLLPTMVNWGNLYLSGNTGNFRGQVRVESFIHPDANTQITLQAALSQPNVTQIDAERLNAQDNGWPNVELRAALGLGDLNNGHRPFEVGVSSVVGQLRSCGCYPGRNEVVDVWGVGSDLRWAMTSTFGVQGEFFAGQGLGTYLGGVGQSVNAASFRSVRTTGGWGEFYYYIMPELHTHLGYGIDNPLDRDLAFGQILQNQTFFSNILWDATSFMRFGLEVSWRQTKFQSLPDNSGVIFQGMMQLSF